MRHRNAPRVIIHSSSFDETRHEARRGRRVDFANCYLSHRPDFPARFFKRQAAFLNVPWTMAVSRDRQAARLEAEPRHFHAVYLPGGGEFFESHAFLYLETEELQDLADRLAIYP